MAEYIGARISLVSRSDIRYVGTLHEINSESSTVALENVTSYGTEGRKGKPEEEIPPSDSVYEYIVFRGSDVKDLRIEEAPAAKENKPPQVPNDPAIMSSSGSRPAAQTQPPAQQQNSQKAPPQNQKNQPGAQGQQGPPNAGPPYGQHPGYPPFYPPPPGNWGRGGPPGPGYPGMPYGAPPGWYPPPGQGFPPGPFPPYNYPPGPPGMQFQPGQQPPGQQQPGQPPKPAPIGPSGNKQQGASPAPAAEKQPEAKDMDMAKPAAEMAAAAVTPSNLTTQAKPADNKAPEPSTAATAAAKAAPAAPAGPKRVQPAIPLQSPALKKAPLPNSSVVSPPTTTSSSLRDATQAATAAVAAAMAKLPHASGQTNGNGMDNLTKQVNEMRTSSGPIRNPRNPGTAAGFANRGGRGRGGRSANGTKVEVPETDFDFESSNAKFNKDDLVKEAIAGSPLAETSQEAPAAETSIPVSYNKQKSFFDDISSESKDRAEGGGNKPGGREWRGEEQKKNVETFGQGSVDNGYRGGYRGRGRGRGGYRGRGYAGNGQPGRGRGGYRGRNDDL